MVSDRAYQLHDRIQRTLDWLPVTAAVRTVRTALSRAANQAYAKLDVPALERIANQASILARSLERNRVQNDPVPPAPAESKPRRRWRPPAAEATGSVNANPTPRARRREYAPVRYAWGEEPVSPPREPEILPSKPESLLSHACRQRLQAMRSHWAAQRDAESEAVRRCGVAQYQNTDDPPTYAWPDPAE